MQNFYALHRQLRQIPKQYQNIHYVTKKGDGIVFLEQEQNGQKTKQKQTTPKSEIENTGIWLPKPLEI